MTTADKMIRQSDGKVFDVVEPAHWTLIIGHGAEEDRVKWLGDDTFVSHTAGHTYKLVRGS